MKMRVGYASTSRSRGAWLSSFYKLWQEVGNHEVIKWAKSRSSGVWGKLESESGKKEREARGDGRRNEGKIVECVSIDGIDCIDE